MLRVDNRLELVRLLWTPVRMFTGRYALMSGKRILTFRWKRVAFESIQAGQTDAPVQLIRDGKRTLWHFHDCFYWEDEGLDADDVTELWFEPSALVDILLLECRRATRGNRCTTSSQPGSLARKQKPQGRSGRGHRLHGVRTAHWRYGALVLRRHRQAAALLQGVRRDRAPRAA